MKISIHAYSPYQGYPIVENKHLIIPADYRQKSGYPVDLYRFIQLSLIKT